MRRLKILPAIAILSMVVACKKGGGDPPPGNNCASLVSIKASPSSTSIEKGKTVSFQTTLISGVIYRWQTPGGLVIASASGELRNIDFNNEGWFLVEATNNCNETKKDSFYLDVTMPQGTPSCAPAGNAISFTAANHPASSFTTVAHGETGIPNDSYRLQASGGGNDLTIAFHPSFKNNKQPENGVYTTGTFNSNWNPMYTSTDFDKVFIVNITYSPTTIYYRSNPNQQVYITRINGKLKATICNMSFAGSSNGTPYTSDITFAVVEN